MLLVTCMACRLHLPSIHSGHSGIAARKVLPAGKAPCIVGSAGFGWTVASLVPLRTAVTGAGIAQYVVRHAIHHCF